MIRTTAKTTRRARLRISRAALAATAALTMAVPAALSPASAQPIGSLDSLGRPAPQVLDQIESVANAPGTPEQVSTVMKKVVSFFRGDGKPGVEVPENGPAFTQFGWPTIAGNCIGGKDKAVGTAMAVPGPAALPLPGVKEGEANFVFTAMGTGKVAQQQNTKMTVHWININTGKIGQTQLGFNGINPEGPATVNGPAATGKGTVLAVLEGGVSTDEGEAGTANCNFLPTAAVIPVP